MAELEKYLNEKKIDQIEDDEEFMIAEYEAVRDYCEERNFKLDKDDMSTIIGRGLYDCFSDWVNDRFIMGEFV